MDEIRIRQAAAAFRAEVDTWSEAQLRKEGADLGIPGSDTVPLVTLAEAIVARRRDSARDAVAYDPELPEGPGTSRIG